MAPFSAERLLLRPPLGGLDRFPRQERLQTLVYVGGCRPWFFGPVFSRLVGRRILEHARLWSQISGEKRKTRLIFPSAKEILCMHALPAPFE